MKIINYIHDIVIHHPNYYSKMFKNQYITGEKLLNLILGEYSSTVENINIPV